MKFKKISLRPKPAIAGLAVAALLAWGLSHWARLPFLGAFALVIAAMVINGAIAQSEDEAPGGFNNRASDSNGRVIFQKEKRTSWRSVGILWGCIIALGFLVWLIAAIGSSGLSDK